MKPASRTAGGTRTLERRYYVDEEVFAHETDHVFRRHWLCVGRESQLARPGSYVLRELEGESLIVMRGDDGQPRCFYNVCRHRGTRLCEQPSDRPVRALRCPYHAWTYDLQGRLTAAPNMRGVSGFRAEDYPLKQAAVAAWQGFLWVHLGETPGDCEPCCEQWFRPLDELLRPWGIERLLPAACLEYEVAANWKLLFQNYNECYHCPTVHPALNALTPYKSAANQVESGPFLGGPMQLAERVESMTLDGRACAEPLPGLDAEQRRQVAYFTLFPTLFLSPHPDFVLVHSIERRGPAATRVVCEFLFPPGAMEAEGFDPEPAVRFWDQTNRQDWHVCELSQRGITSRAYEPGPYADLESVVAAFDRYYLQRLAGENSPDERPESHGA